MVDIPAPTSFSLTQDDREILDDLSELTGMSKTAVAREAFRQYADVARGRREQVQEHARRTRALLEARP